MCSTGDHQACDVLYRYEMARSAVPPQAANLFKSRRSPVRPSCWLGGRVGRRTAWLGISDSNCRIRPRATQLDLRDNFAGGRRKSGGGDPSRTSCVAPTGGHHNRVRAMGIRDRPISPRSPWQNPVAERLIGTRTAFARGSDSAAAPVRPSSTEASVALRTSSGPSPGTVRLCSEPAFS
jgi:hypothetical protein